jgi:hypothetical protein
MSEIKNMENAAGVGLTILIVTQIPQIYQTMLPYPCDIEKEDPDSRYSKAVRKSNYVTAGLAVGMGFAGSLITQTPWPFFGALAITAFMVWHYNSAINYYNDEREEK